MNSVFETTIRVLGGLLTAYDLTKDKMYLKKAEDIAKRLKPAFNTPSGYPKVVSCFEYDGKGSVNFHSGYSVNPQWTGGKSLLAEVGTVSLEFLQLAKFTGNQEYKAMIDKIYTSLEASPTWDGLLSTFMNVDNGRMEGGAFTMSGCGDSHYEYLLKMWIQSGKKDEVRAGSVYDV